MWVLWVNGIQVAEDLDFYSPGVAELSRLSVDDHGSFLTWDGRVHPW